MPRELERLKICKMVGGHLGVCAPTYSLIPLGSVKCLACSKVKLLFGTSWLFLVGLKVELRITAHDKHHTPEPQSPADN